MSEVLEEGIGCLRKIKAIRSAPASWNMMSPRSIDRRDLSRLYCMDPVPDYIYEAIMRADNGQSTPSEILILDHYITEKKSEIRRRKLEIGAEGRGERTSVGKTGENVMVNLLRDSLKKIGEDDFDG